MIKCEYCGYEISDDNAKFCSSCGKPIKIETTNKITLDNLNIINMQLKSYDSEELEKTIINYYFSQNQKILTQDTDYWVYMMALLFWDIIFMKTDTCTAVKIDNPKFEGLYQFMLNYTGLPNDFFKDDFYKTRQTEINNRLNQLINEDISKFILESFQKNFGKPSKLIALWDKFSKEELVLITDKIRKSDLIKIQKRLITNFIDTRSTIPSTIVYDDNKAKLVEIIDNKDLSVNQIKWYKFIKELDVELDLLVFNRNEDEIKEIINKL